MTKSHTLTVSQMSLTSFWDSRTWETRLFKMPRLEKPCLKTGTRITVASEHYLINEGSQIMESNSRCLFRSLANSLPLAQNGVTTGCKMSCVEEFPEVDLTTQFLYIHGFDHSQFS